MRQRAVLRLILALLLAVSAGAPGVAAEGFRNIASVTVASYFDGDFGVESTDTFLARVTPALTLLARAARNDTPDFWQHVFTLGPVVNFSDTVYGEVTYGLGIDSGGDLTHEAEASINHETEATWAGAGMRAVFFPASTHRVGYYYLLPSFSGKFRPIPALGLFGKAFISIDSESVVTNSFWGEADYAFSPVVTANAGFTVSRAEGLGYSLIAGARVSFAPNVSLQYALQYLSDTVSYEEEEPRTRSGISNGLILDWKF